MDTKNENWEPICRTCLTKSKCMTDIFIVADIIMSCAPIQLEPDDGLPSMICSECMVLAKKAYGFRSLCEHSDKFLRRKLLKRTIKIENDVDSVEIPSGSDCFKYNETVHSHYQTSDSQPTINNINEVNKTETCDIYEDENFEHKYEIDEDKDDETLITDPTLWDSMQSVHNQNKDTDFETIINEVNKEEHYGSGNENSNVFDDDTSDADEYFENESKLGLTCQYCGQEFLTKSRFKMHIQRHIKGLKCQFCGKDFQNLRQFQSHVYTHKRKGSHLCPTCGKQFTLPENLAVHQRIHTGIKPYTCKWCSRSFTQSSDLKSHVTIHTSERPFLCSICGNKFARSSALRSHTNRMHPNPYNERPHACTICGVKFKVPRDLSSHMLRHTNERNCICKVCNKAFKSNKCLRQHEKIHKGHKPHVCPVCQRSFLQKHVLITHLRTH